MRILKDSKTTPRPFKERVKDWVSRSVAVKGAGAVLVVTSVVGLVLRKRRRQSGQAKG